MTSFAPDGPPLRVLPIDGGVELELDGCFQTTNFAGKRVHGRFIWQYDNYGQIKNAARRNAGWFDNTFWQGICRRTLSPYATGDVVGDAMVLFGRRREPRCLARQRRPVHSRRNRSDATPPFLTMGLRTQGWQQPVRAPYSIVNTASLEL